MKALTKRFLSQSDSSVRLETKHYENMESGQPMERKTGEPKIGGFLKKLFSGKKADVYGLTGTVGSDRYFLMCLLVFSRRT